MPWAAFSLPSRLGWLLAPPEVGIPREIGRSMIRQNIVIIKDDDIFQVVILQPTVRSRTTSY